MKSRIYIQVAISLTGVLLIVIHLIWPQLAIDIITLGLLVVVIIPWLAPLFKSLKLPGGVEFEYQELEKAREKAESSGLITSSISPSKFKSVYVPTPSEDPTLTPAWLRIEIEKRHREIARKNKVSDDRSMHKILLSLNEKQLISQQEMAALMDVTGVLNKAIHGIELDRTAADWALSIGPGLLDSLDKRITKK